jgi:putative transcriptional regulator
MRDEDFQDLITAVQQAVEHHQGLRHDLRTTMLPMPPGAMDAGEIGRLRERIGLSQRVFAMALNVSIKTVQAWESGARVPDGGNLKLLRLGEAHPEVVFGRLYTPPVQPAEPVEPAKPRVRRKAKAQAA